MENPKESRNQNRIRLPNDVLGLICTDFLPRQHRSWLLLLDSSLRLAIQASLFSKDLGISRTKQLAHYYQNLSQKKHFLVDNRETILRYLKSDTANDEERFIWLLIEQQLSNPNRPLILNTPLLNAFYESLRILQSHLAGFLLLGGFTPEYPKQYSFVIKRDWMQVVPFEIFSREAFGDDRTDFLQYCLNNIVQDTPFRKKSRQCLKLWLANKTPSHKQAVLLFEQQNATADHKDPSIRRDILSLVPASNPAAIREMRGLLYSGALAVSRWAFLHMFPVTLRRMLWGIENVFYTALWHESYQAAHPQRDAFEKWLAYRPDKTLFTLFCDSLEQAMSSERFTQRCNALYLLAMLAPYLSPSEGQYMTNIFTKTVCNQNENGDVLYVATTVFSGLIKQLFFSERERTDILQFTAEPVSDSRRECQLSFLLSIVPYLSQTQYRDALAILCGKYFQIPFGKTPFNLETRMEQALKYLFARTPAPEHINRLYEYALPELRHFQPRCYKHYAKPTLLKLLPPYLDGEQVNQAVEAILENFFLSEDDIFAYLNILLLQSRHMPNAANQFRILQLASSSLLDPDKYIEHDVLRVFLLTYSPPYTKLLDKVIKAVLAEAPMIIATCTAWNHREDRLDKTFAHMKQIVPYCSKTDILSIIKLLKKSLRQFAAVDTVLDINGVLEVIIEHKKLDETALKRFFNHPLKKEQFAPERVIKVLKFLQNKGIASATLDKTLLQVLQRGNEMQRQKALQATWSLHFFATQNGKKIDLPSVSGDSEEYSAAEAIMRTL